MRRTRPWHFWLVESREDRGEVTVRGRRSSSRGFNRSRSDRCSSHRGSSGGRCDFLEHRVHDHRSSDGSDRCRVRCASRSDSLGETIILEDVRDRSSDRCRRSADARGGLRCDLRSRGGSRRSTKQTCRRVEGQTGSSVQLLQGFQATLLGTFGLGLDPGVHVDQLLEDRRVERSRLRGRSEGIACVHTRARLLDLEDVTILQREDVLALRVGPNFGLREDAVVGILGDVDENRRRRILVTVGEDQRVEHDARTSDHAVVVILQFLRARLAVGSPEQVADRVAVEVVAFNQRGDRAPVVSAPTIAATVAVTFADLDAPTNVNVTDVHFEADAKVAVNFTPPVDMTGVRNFEVQYKRATDGVWTSVGYVGSGPVEIPGLATGNYTARVRSSNTNSTSTWAQDDFVVAVAPGSLMANWNARNDRNGSAITPPTLPAIGSVEHTANTDGSVNLSFEWLWAGSEATIDGFQVTINDT